MTRLLIERACVKGNVKTLRSFLTNISEEGLNEQNEQGLTLLQQAVQADKVESVRALLECKADPNALSSTGYSPLMAAAAAGSKPLCELLVKAGGDPNLEDASGRSAADYGEGTGVAEALGMVDKAGKAKETSNRMSVGRRRRRLGKDKETSGRDAAPTVKGDGSPENRIGVEGGRKLEALNTEWEVRVGIHNELPDGSCGNSCFIIAVLQCIRVGCHEILDTLAEAGQEVDAKKRGVSKAVLNLHKQMQIAPVNGAVSLHQLHAEMSKHLPVLVCSSMQQQQQQDAQEMLAALLDAFENAIPKLVQSTAQKANLLENLKRNQALVLEALQYSVDPTPFIENIRVLCDASWSVHQASCPPPLDQLVWGQLVSTIRCHKCNSWATVNAEPFQMLQIQFDGEQEVSLEDRINAFFADDLKDDYQCEHCKAKNCCHQSTLLSRLPMFLICHVNGRFTQALEKNRTALRVPSKIDISKHFQWLAPSTDIQHTYELVAKCLHRGSMLEYGHYTAHISTRHGWLHYDDETVSEVPLEQLDQDAYLIFYKEVHNF